MSLGKPRLGEFYIGYYSVCFGEHVGITLAVSRRRRRLPSLGFWCLPIVRSPGASIIVRSTNDLVIFADFFIFLFFAHFCRSSETFT
jgi:hypothetical protein